MKPIIAITEIHLQKSGVLLSNILELHETIAWV